MSQNKEKSFLDYLIVFFLSLFSISLELFFTSILNLKTWNHVVYVIIPFAILGYGVGANTYLILKNKIDRIKKRHLFGILLFILAFLSVGATLSIIYLPIRLSYLMKFFVDIQAAFNLYISYSIIMIPFIIIGFLVVYIFSENPKLSNKLYFCDLLGAGTGAIVFFLLINWLGVFRSLLFLSSISLTLCAGIACHKKRYISFTVFLVGFLISLGLSEPTYVIDKAKNWEYIPGFFKKYQYETIVSKWNPFGRTDAYRFKDKKIEDEIYNSQIGTFEINTQPIPEFSYFCNNFLSGSPIYKYRSLLGEDFNRNKYAVKLFSQAIEFPYLLLDEPKVVIIGSGGGRDIFIAKTHKAKEIIAAEINPVIYKEMSKNGKFYQYSGEIYGLEGVKVLNVDGRHLVKKLKPGYFNLIVLNGVDTFTGLSQGAYTYAESYLYTKNALRDYLRILDRKGMINFNRWFFGSKPRETLRLFVIAMDSLRSLEAEKPWKHIIVGYHKGWGMMLIKKTPFNEKEKSLIRRYFKEHNTYTIFPSLNWENKNKDNFNFFDLYVKSFIKGKEKQFIDSYPFDISVISDDNPFFYKYYRLRDFRIKNILISKKHAVTGTVVFMSQVLALIHTLVFIILFVLLPLFIFKRKGIKSVLRKSRIFSFIIFFSCLGVGFMFIELPTMQRFVLLLGSPIYSISVTLAGLLIFSGLGSLLLTYFQKNIKNRETLLTIVTFFLTVYLFLYIFLGRKIIDYFIPLSFFWRILIVLIMILPLGICLGMFFPSGLKLIAKDCREAIPWAWGINLGFTVLGSILAIILAQFYGFSLLFFIAILLYLIAMIAFRRISKVL